MKLDEALFIVRECLQYRKASLPLAARTLAAEVEGLKERVAQLEAAAKAMNTRLREIYYEASEHSPVLSKGNDSPSLLEWLRETALSYKAQRGEGSRTMDKLRELLRAINAHEQPPNEVIVPAIEWLPKLLTRVVELEAWAKTVIANASRQPYAGAHYECVLCGQMGKHMEWCPVSTFEQIGVALDQRREESS